MTQNYRSEETQRLLDEYEIIKKEYNEWYDSYMDVFYELIGCELPECISMDYIESNMDDMTPEELANDLKSKLRDFLK